MPEALPAASDERSKTKNCLVKGTGCLAVFAAVTVGGGVLFANWLNGSGNNSSEAEPSETYASASAYPSETAEEPSQLVEPSDEEEPTVDEEPTTQAPTAEPQNTDAETTAPPAGKEQSDDCPWSPSNPQPLNGKSIRVFPACMGVSGGFDTYSYSRQELNGQVHLEPGQNVTAVCAWPGQTYTGVITAKGEKALLDDRAAGYVGYKNGKPGLPQCAN
ncbi:MAG TPA: hypothetical protein VFI74_01700 [Candidatus Saccharimonadales bacterium]|nr:hypothetical protein [Candidatus Saccharimonadales bacterium]